MENPGNTALEARQDLVEQYRQLFEEAPIAYHELNVQGIVQRVSNAECRLLGYTREEMCGKHICDFVPPAERQACMESFVRKVRGNLSSALSWRRYRTKDNRDIVVEIHDQLLHDSEGKIAGTRTALLDVTKRIEKEVLLQENQLRFLNVFHSMREAIVVLDPLGAVILMNSRAEELLGWSKRSLEGKPLATTIQAALVPRFPSTHPYSPKLGLTEPWYGFATFITEQGEQRQSATSSAPILSTENDCIGILILCE
jgi:PAS domain S-box-containing protein